MGAITDDEHEEVEISEGKKDWITKKFRTAKLVLTLKDVEHLKRLEHPRRTRESQVNQIVRALMKGIKLEGHLVLNDVSTAATKRFRVIDGNHRTLAIIIFLEENPTAVVRVEARIYDHLTEEEELEIFKRCNTVVNFTTEDMFTSRQEQLPIYAMIEKKGFPFPCKLYYPKGVEGGVKFLNLVKAYLARHNVYNTSSKSLFDMAQRLTEEDYGLLVQFATDMVAVCGKPTAGNFWYNSTPLNALMKTYFSNLKRLGRTEVVRRLRTKVVTDATVVDVARRANLSLVKALNIQMVEAANKGYSTEDKMFIDTKTFQSGALSA